MNQPPLNLDLDELALAPTKPVGGVALPVYKLTSPIGRNEKCPCGSSRKFKRCCLAKQQSQLLQFETELEQKVLAAWQPGRSCRQLATLPPSPSSENEVQP